MPPRRRSQPPLPFRRPVSRRRYALRRGAGVAILAALLGALAIADRAGLFGRRDAAPVARPLPKPEEDRARYDGKSFRVVRVVDGDTLIIEPIDYDGNPTRIRLWGVDTPETVHPDRPRPDHFGPEASAFTKQAAQGKAVRIELEPGRSTRDRHKRLLAWITLPDGSLLNSELVAQGYAFADPRFPHHRMAALQRLQAQARASRRGLWKDAQPDDVPGYLK